MFQTPNPHKPLADPDLKLRRGPGFVLLALLAFLPSGISSFCYQKEGGGGRSLPSLDPPL